MTRVIVIGAGFGGLGMVRALRERGVTDVTVLERADDVGGVWRDNTYPNAACDVPSPLYSWSWAPNPHWQRRYSKQPAILDYLKTAATDEGLLDHVVTNAEVETCVYDETEAIWRVTTTDGTVREAEVVVSAVGQLSNPVIPNIPGRDDFAGPSFHSAEWDHGVDLAGKKVAVIGTGASAIQFVPGIVDEVAEMTVFQRSAPYVIPKPDQRYGPLYQRAFKKIPITMSTERASIFWASEVLNRALGGNSRTSAPMIASLKGLWRLTMRLQVKDADLRAKLQPDYELGCKRLLFSNDWYPALNRNHVDVVTEGVTAIEADGVRTADGELHAADVVIWGTGFAATQFLAPMKIEGLGGQDLHEHWKEGARAHLGLVTEGFPNLFFVYGPNTNLGGSSIINMMESQSDWIAQVVEGIQGGRVRAAKVKDQVAAEFDAEMQERLSKSAWVGCDSWYADGDRITTNWPGLVAEFKVRTAEVDWNELEDAAR